MDVVRLSKGNDALQADILSGVFAREREESGMKPINRDDEENAPDKSASQQESLNQEHSLQGRTQTSRFGGVPQDSESTESEVDQDPGERQKRNQGDIEEDKLAS